MRITLPHVEAAIATHNDKRTHARKVLTIPSTQFVETIGMT
jgi:hypothetical protein